MEAAWEAEVKLIGCQVIMDVMGAKQEYLLEGVQAGGAVTYIAAAAKA
ncbi:hypothetical protein DFAR_2590016 [Desulfarculales bacterium]